MSSRSTGPADALVPASLMNDLRGGCSPRRSWRGEPASQVNRQEGGGGRIWRTGQGEELS